jgi:hypothetical protein
MKELKILSFWGAFASLFPKLHITGGVEARRFDMEPQPFMFSSCYGFVENVLKYGFSTPLKKSENVRSLNVTWHFYMSLCNRSHVCVHGARIRFITQEAQRYLYVSISFYRGLRVVPRGRQLSTHVFRENILTKGICRICQAQVKKYVG